MYSSLIGSSLCLLLFFVVGVCPFLHKTGNVEVVVLNVTVSSYIVCELDKHVYANRNGFKINNFSTESPTTESESNQSCFRMVITATYQNYAHLLNLPMKFLPLFFSNIRIIIIICIPPFMHK